MPAVVAFRDGYINGAKSVNPDIEVLYQESDPNPEIGFNDPVRGGEIASQMLELGDEGPASPPVRGPLPLEPRR